MTSPKPENREFAKSMDIRDRGNRENNVNKKTVEGEEGGVAGLTREERKEISRMLISEVHFCRFLFKLGQRIKA